MAGGQALAGLLVLTVLPGVCGRPGGAGSGAEGEAHEGGRDTVLEDVFSDWDVWEMGEEVEELSYYDYDYEGWEEVDELSDLQESTTPPTDEEIIEAALDDIFWR
jgi:hypothetical protein